MALLLTSSAGARSSGASGSVEFHSAPLLHCPGVEVIRWSRRPRVMRVGWSGDCRTTWALTASAPGDCSNASEPSEMQEMNAGDLKEKLAKLGRAGLLAYGIFNGITYTTFFFIAFLAIEKTGKNPANDLKACLGAMVSMWTGNNFTRPLRVAAAAALAPVTDKLLKKTQQWLHLEDEASAFLYLAIVLWGCCGAAVGLLILSRMGR